MYSYHSTQTLTKLDLSVNRIDFEGAQHLSNALKHNKVNFVLYSFVSYAFVLYRHLTH